jgi:hypothetical protein
MGATHPFDDRRVIADFTKKIEGAVMIQELSCQNAQVPPSLSGAQDRPNADNGSRVSAFRVRFSDAPLNESMKRGE